MISLEDVGRKTYRLTRLFDGSKHRGVSVLAGEKSLQVIAGHQLAMRHRGRRSREGGKLGMRKQFGQLQILLDSIDHLGTFESDLEAP